MKTYLIAVIFLGSICLIGAEKKKKYPKLPYPLHSMRISHEEIPRLDVWNEKGQGYIGANCVPVEYKGKKYLIANRHVMKFDPFFAKISKHQDLAIIYCDASKFKTIKLKEVELNQGDEVYCKGWEPSSKDKTKQYIGTSRFYKFHTHRGGRYGLVETVFSVKGISGSPCFKKDTDEFIGIVMGTNRSGWNHNTKRGAFIPVRQIMEFIDQVEEGSEDKKNRGAHR